MKYIAVIFFALFGLVELALRILVIPVSFFMVLAFVEDLDDFFTPYLFKLADATARGW